MKAHWDLFLCTVFQNYAAQVCTVETCGAFLNRGRKIRKRAQVEPTSASHYLSAKAANNIELANLESVVTKRLNRKDIPVKRNGPLPFSEM